MRLLNLLYKKNSVYESPHLQELEEKISLLPAPAIRNELFSQLSNTERAYRKFIKNLQERPGFIQEKAIRLHQIFYLILLRRTIKLQTHKTDLLSENSDVQKRSRNKVLLRLLTFSIRMSYRWIYLFEKLYRKHRRKVFYYLHAELYMRVYLLSYENLKEKIEKAEKDMKK